MPDYKQRTKGSWRRLGQNLKGYKTTDIDFEYYHVASSLFSSKIEGNSLDFNSFYNNRKAKAFARSKEVEEINDLVLAYRFANASIFNESNFLKAHRLFSKMLLSFSKRGKYRKHQVGIWDTITGRPVYMAIEAEFVNEEMKKLFADIEFLLGANLSKSEIFYYASMIHVWIALIHPFEDGNGRAARLAEKWFLVAKLGPMAWAIPSEKYYWDNRPDYYKNISLGYNYYVLKWERCMDFLLMLPKAVQ